MINAEIPILAKKIVKQYNTNDPEELAGFLNITIINMPMGNNIAGYYKYMKRRKYVFINSEIKNRIYQRVVLAHELGHALLHRSENCTFMNGHTLLLTSKIERQANLFAAYLIIDDNMLHDYENFTREQFCDCTGFPEELIELRLK